jgi:hypothetical protein
MEIESALGRGQSTGGVLARGVTISQLIDKYRELRDRARPVLDMSNEHYILQHLQEGVGSFEVAAFSTSQSSVGTLSSQVRAWLAGLVCGC